MSDPVHITQRRVTDRVLADDFGEEFAELAEEVNLVHDELRTFGEILEAEQEYFDKVW